MIEAVSTGHPLITTLHANNAVQIFDRIYNMGQSKIKINKSDFSLMLATFFNIGIHMQAVKSSQGIVRQITQIVEYYVEDNRIIYNVIYEKVNGQEIYHNLSKELANRLKIDEMWY